MSPSCSRNLLKTRLRTWRVSDREFRSKIVPYEYSNRFETRVANRAGEIKFIGKSHRLSEVFIDEQVGLQPSDTDGVWDVFYTDSW